MLVKINKYHYGYGTTYGGDGWVPIQNTGRVSNQLHQLNKEVHLMELLEVDNSAPEDMKIVCFTLTSSLCHAHSPPSHHHHQHYYRTPINHHEHHHQPFTQSPVSYSRLPYEQYRSHLCCHKTHTYFSSAWDKIPKRISTQCRTSTENEIWKGWNDSPQHPLVTQSVWGIFPSPPHSHCAAW